MALEYQVELQLLQSLPTQSQLTLSLRSATPVQFRIVTIQLMRTSNTTSSKEILEQPKVILVTAVINRMMKFTTLAMLTHFKSSVEIQQYLLRIKTS